MSVFGLPSVTTRCNLVFGAILVIFVSPSATTVHRTNATAGFTMDDLTSNVFPHLTSSDVDIDPCKAGKF